jgi:hypothetical protein
MQKRSSTSWLRIKKARRVVAWISLLFAASLLISHNMIIGYPGAIGYQGAPRPPRWMYEWRYWSLMLTLILSLISLPRWQSFVGLGIAVVFLYFESLI